MFKSQLKFQKILFLVVLFLQVALFIYSIGLATDFYPLYLCEGYGIDVSNAQDGKAIMFFDNLQIYNSQLIKFVIVLIVISLLPFIFNSNKRRKYYIDNFITQTIQVAAYVACSIFLIINTINYKADFLSIVNLEEYTRICTEKSWYFTGSTIFFDLGYVFAALLIVSAILIGLNYYWKYKLVELENKIINGEVQ